MYREKIAAYVLLANALGILLVLLLSLYMNASFPIFCFASNDYKQVLLISLFFIVNAILFLRHSLYGWVCLIIFSLLWSLFTAITFYKSLMSSKIDLSFFLALSILSCSIYCLTQRTHR